MKPYAVIETGGQQYRVEPGAKLTVERLPGEVGETIDVDTVLAVSDGETIQVGTPQLDAAKVTFSVLDHIRGDKVVSFKKKRRKGYTRKVGHRQELTVLKTESIG